MSERWVPFTCTLDCGSRCELLALVVDGHLARYKYQAPGHDSLAVVPDGCGRLLCTHYAHIASL